VIETQSISETLMDVSRMSKVGAPEILGRVTFDDIVIKALDVEADNEVRLLDGPKGRQPDLPGIRKRSSWVS
jgi:hypothetical protein